MIQTTTTTTRPVLEQRVYNERVTAPVHPEPVHAAPLVTPKVTTENNQIRTENHELRIKVADLQMRVDRLLKGRDQVEAEGSGRFSFSAWIEPQQSRIRLWVCCHNTAGVRASARASV